MANTFHIMISTPHEVCVDDEVCQATLPTELGKTGILPNHAKIVGIIKAGKIHLIYPNNKEEYCLINHGIYSFSGNRLTVMSDFFKKGTENVDPNIFYKVKEQIEKGMKEADLTENVKKAIYTYIQRIGSKIKKK